MNQNHEILELCARILIRCFLMGFFTLVFWFGAVKLAGDLTYSVHASLFSITRQQFDVIHYAGMLMVKAVVFFLFLFPYIAIRWVMRRRPPLTP